MPTPATNPRREETPSNMDKTPRVLPTEPSSGRGRRHGTSSTEPFDRWFRYPAGFASDYAATLLEHLSLSHRGIVVDPFAGSAVTGTAAQRLGLSFYGIETHPLIAELGQLKLQEPPAAGASLTIACERLIEAGNKILSTKDTPDLDRETSLVQQCFAKDTLIQLVTLRDLIRAGEAGVWTSYLKWALLATLRDVASARVGWPYQRPANQRQPQYKDVVNRLRQRAQMMAEDLDRFYEYQAPSRTDNRYTSQLVCGDARISESWAKLPTTGAHGCVSSPPYLNNFDYADATRLELYFWGDATNWSEMCGHVRSGMITATTQQSSVGAAAAATQQLRAFGSTAEKIEILTGQLREERLARTRGKEYDRVVPAYFAAIAQVLRNLANALSSRAPAVLLIGDSAPYGVYIDTPTLIAELAQQCGLDREKDIVLRRRGLRWASNSQRHDVQLSERLVLLRRQ
ncbi:DNA methyltransferase [Microbispora bryophytorum]|uniref:DNA methyltransferase n=1 Tax=Microbispora bryophytorum TaxID=1460882 RepID=UPI00371F66BB